MLDFEDEDKDGAGGELEIEDEGFELAAALLDEE